MTECRSRHEPRRSPAPGPVMAVGSILLGASVIVIVIWSPGRSAVGSPWHAERSPDLMGTVVGMRSGDGIPGVARVMISTIDQGDVSVTVSEESTISTCGSNDGRVIADRAALLDAAGVVASIWLQLPADRSGSREVEAIALGSCG